MNYLKSLTVGAAIMTFSSPAFAQTLGGGGCSTDLTLNAGSSLFNCYGRYTGNVLSNNSGDNANINAALTALGYGGPVISYGALPSGSIITPLNGAPAVNFPGLFNGTLFLGVHYGGGQGGGQTTFYRVNASNLDIIGLNLSASSTATVLAQVAASVPEPASWALMLAGFGAIGYTLRRGKRQTKLSFA